MSEQGSLPAGGGAAAAVAAVAALIARVAWVALWVMGDAASGSLGGVA